MSPADRVRAENECLRELTRLGAPISAEVRAAVRKLAARCCAQPGGWPDAEVTPTVIPKHVRTLPQWKLEKTDE